MTILSWGLGLQSTTLLELSLSGDYSLPKLDAAIFCDTGFEHDYSYQVYNFYAPRAKKAGIKVVKIGGQNILQDSYHKVSLPLYVGTTGRQIIRKCTRDYKIRPIHRQIRDLLGVGRRGRLAADLVNLWLGITLDEVHRAKDSRVAFITHQFPLLDLHWERQDCAKYLKGKGLPIPKKSSCQFCPYKSHQEWLNLKRRHPRAFALIADLERHINRRQLVKIAGRAKSVHFNRSGSLLQADFSKAKPTIDGMCDGGFCHG
jgi:hypothetical protein